MASKVSDEQITDWTGLFLDLNPFLDPNKLNDLCVKLR